MVGQLKDRALANAGAGTAGAIEGGYDAVLSGGRAIAEGASDFKGTVDRSFRPAAEKIDRAASRIGEAINSASGGAGRLSGQQVSTLARKALPIKQEAMRHGFNDADAAAIAANIVMESGGDHRARERGASRAGRGLIQWTSRDRKANFRRVMGVDVSSSSREQQWSFLRWELQNTHAGAWRKAHARGADAANVAAGFTRYVETPADIRGNSAERAAIAQKIGEPTPVHVTVELKNAAPGTRATVRAGHGNRPAISHAMQH